MNKIEYTAKLVEQYSIRLAEAIQKNNSYVIKAEDYFYIVDDLLSALSEFKESFNPEYYSNEMKKGYLQQLLYQVQVGTINKLPNFDHITIDLTKVCIL